MDAQNATRSTLASSDAAMAALLNKNQNIQNMVDAQRQKALAASQQAPDNMQQTMASGDPDASMPAVTTPDTAPTPVGVTAPAPSVKAAKVPVSGTGVYANPNQTPNQTDAESARLARSGDKPVYGPFSSPLMEQQQRFNELKRLNPASAGVNAASAAPAAATDLNAFNAQKQALRPGWKPGNQTDMAQTGAAMPADKPTQYDPVIQQAAQQAGVDPTVLKRLLASESSFNPTAVSPRGAQYGYGIAQIAASHGLTKQQMEDPSVAIPFAAKLLRQYADNNGGDMNKALLQYKGASSPTGIASMQPVVAKILTGLAPGSNAQAATPPQQAPAQGPVFVAANGSKFSVPQQYNDGQIQQMQQQAQMAKNAAQLAWMQYQQNPSQVTAAAVQSANATVQQLHQGLYDAQVYAATQQAQGGNPKAFSALLNEYSNKVGQPIQIVPGGNGLYQLRTRSGQVIAQGDPSTIAGTLGGVLNSGARANAMKIAQIHAEEYAKATAQEQAKQPIELAKLQTELAKQMGINASQQIIEKIKLGKVTVTPNANGQFLLTDTDSGQATLVDPNDKTPIGTPRQSHIRTP